MIYFIIGCVVGGLAVLWAQWLVNKMFDEG